MRWIAGPGLQLGQCSADRSGNELEAYICAVPGSSASVVLSRWTTPGAAREYLEQNLGAGQDDAEAAVTTWRLDAFGSDPALSGYAYAYQNYPYSIAVTGSVAERDAVVRTLHPRAAAVVEVSQ